MESLQAYDWPGNIRELENTIDRAVILSRDSVLRIDESLRAPEPPAGLPVAAGSLVDVERAHMVRVLDQCGWKIAGTGNAADRLGLKRTTLISRMKKLGLTRPRY